MSETTREPMTSEQHRRAGQLYDIAFDALFKLSEARLNFDGPTRRALDTARQALDDFDSLRCQQPRRFPASESMTGGAR